MTVILGLVGRKRVGKDTFAGRLVSEYGFTRLAFADNVRQAALDLDPIVDVVPWRDEFEPRDFGADVVHLSMLVEAEGWELAKERPEVRRVLQRFGTETIRKLDPDFWVRPVMEQAIRLVKEGRPVVITDVRFLNEAKAVERASGALIRIVRPGLDDRDTHASETELDRRWCDFVLMNDGTLEDWQRTADEIGMEMLEYARR